MQLNSKVKLSAHCMNCLITRQMENLREDISEEIRSDYMKKVFEIIGTSEPEATAPVLIARINEVHEQFFGNAYSFEQLKKDYNQLMLAEEEKIAERISLAKDPIYRAVQYARAGNYIDFGAMGSVDNQKLFELLDKAEEEAVDSQEYANFRQDMETAQKLVYLTDNCGEIVLDKLLISWLQIKYPGVQITAVVRGEPVLNDATTEDAKMTGLSDLVPVIGNGTRIAGTSLDCISLQAKEVIQSADLILSKGQGNFETLNGCGLNVYYMFLCKCSWFVTRFGLELYKGVFTNDIRLQRGE